MLRHIYRTHIKNYLPKFLRKMISGFVSIFRKKDLYQMQIKEGLLNWHKIWKNPLFPYSWANEYKAEMFPCVEDKSCNLFFIEKQGLKLYFADSVDNGFEPCQESAAFLAMEQDLFSPHRYVTKENKMWGTLERAESEVHDEIPFFVEKGDIVADIGASNGNFSISVIENAKHIYLFEADCVWNIPLQKTFEKYKDKITIINKYVSDVDDENSVALDTFFKNKEVNFIKADIEGYEWQLLKGVKNILNTRNNIKCSVCTYHKPQDAQDFKNFFKESGYKTYFTDGYMFCPINNTLQNTSFLRKGVIRAWKT